VRGNALLRDSTVRAVRTRVTIHYATSRHLAKKFSKAWAPHPGSPRAPSFLGQQE